MRAALHYKSAGKQGGLPSALRRNPNLAPPERTALHSWAHAARRRRRGKGRGRAKGWMFLRGG
eukprot:4829814-Pyramimonas_sp.AAC.1